MEKKLNIKKYFKRKKNHYVKIPIILNNFNLFDK